MPGNRILSTTKIGNHGGVKTIGLVSSQLTGRIGGNATRINHADGEILLVQKRSQFVPVAACRFQADMDHTTGVFLEPFAQLFVPNAIVARLERRRVTFLDKNRIKGLFWKCLYPGVMVSW